MVIRMDKEVNITVEDIIKFLNALDKTKFSGPEIISPWLLKECATEFAEP